MNHIRQYFQREERLLNDSKTQKPRIAPTIRFRDMSDLLKSAGKVAVNLRGVGTGSSMQAISMVDIETGEEATTNNPPVDDDEEPRIPGLSAEEWEREAGFDEVIEPAEEGLRDRFEVDGINLADPMLIDLPSDEPVPGVILRGAKSVKKRSAPDGRPLVAEGSRKKFALERYQF